jgi:CPA1 family monovalent cation:H+ antiporter
VAFAITVARRSPLVMPARLRVPSYAVWEAVVFILNVLAFLLIGLQIGPIWAHLSAAERRSYVIVAAAVLVTTIVTRFFWVFAYKAATRRRAREVHGGRGGVMRAGFVLSWCGMRGIVTLAAALALPGADGDGKHAFPYRELILLAAFGVVIGTLVLQGFTLRPILARLRLKEDTSVDREVNDARTRTLQAALGALRGEDAPAAAFLRREYEEALARAASEDGRVPDRLAGDAFRARAVRAARAALAGMRSSGEIGDDAFHRVEEELDRIELSTDGRS